MNYLLDPYFYIYYGVLVLVLMFFYGVVKRVGVALYSFTHVFFVISVVFGFGPGYFISAGSINEMIYTGFYRGFDYELYYVYMVSLVVTVVALILGSMIVGNKKILLSLRGYPYRRFYFVLLFILIYSIVFFIWLPKIPLNDLVAGKGIVQAYKSRMDITHGFAELKPPFLLRYWRFFLNYVPVILFLILMSFVYSGYKKYSKAYMLMFFLFVVYLLVFTIEKSNVVKFLIVALFFNRLLVVGLDMKWNEFRFIMSKEFGLLFIVFIGVLQLIYAYFTSGGGFSDALLRMVNQTSGDYVQVDIVRENGLLGLSGLESRLLKFIGVEQAENLSVQASRSIMGVDNDGPAGTVGGMFATNIFYIVGWSFPLFLFVYIIILGVFDKLIVNSINTAASLERSVLLSFYCYGLFWISFLAFSSPLSIFSFDFILSPSLILLLLMFLCFFSFSSLRRKRLIV